MTIIVPFAAGGSTDIAARLIAERLSALTGGRFVVENRTGAGGAIGSEAVKRAPADGHTLLMASASSHGANPAVFRDLSYDAVADFSAIALTGVTPLALAVAPQGPKDLARLRANLADGRGSYGSAGVGSITHLAGELFLARTALRAEHIPYRGGAPALEALARGEVTLAPVVEFTSRVLISSIRVTEHSPIFCGRPFAMTLDENSPLRGFAPTRKNKVSANMMTYLAGNTACLLMTRHSLPIGLIHPPFSPNRE